MIEKISCYFIVEFNYRIDDMEKEKMKLTKDMIEAGDMYQKLKFKLDFKSKKRRKSSLKHKTLKNDDLLKTRRENTQITDDQNNSVIIWSVSDNIFPKVFTIHKINN